MKTIKLFLASSAELKADRQAFEGFINRKNKDWVARGVFLELVIWEDFLDAVSQTRLQDEYNQAIRDCDLFLMLFWTKVGRYTQEEFETAFGRFQGVGWIRRAARRLGPGMMAGAPHPPSAGG